MKLQIVSVGQRMPAWVESAAETYLKRMPHECRVTIQEIPAAKRNKQSEVSRMVREEADRIQKAIRPGDHVVALDLSGQNWSTEQLAEQMRGWQGVHPQVSLLVGGPDGLDSQCVAQADQVWSLSKLTFPHPLVRVILAEQLYRAWSLINNHPYHR